MAASQITRDALQSKCIAQTLTGGLRGHFITTQFSFFADTVRQPPDGWMIKQDRFHEPLTQIDPQIEPADVSQFVSDNRFECRYR